VDQGGIPRGADSLFPLTVSVESPISGVSSVLSIWPVCRSSPQTLLGAITSSFSDFSNKHGNQLIFSRFIIAIDAILFLSQLSSVAFGPSLVSIRTSAFSQTSRASITNPGQVSKISPSAFEVCSKLALVTFYGGLNLIRSTAFLIDRHS
jgi:hypothetical protein